MGIPHVQELKHLDVELRQVLEYNHDYLCDEIVFSLYTLLFPLRVFISEEIVAKV